MTQEELASKLTQILGKVTVTPKGAYDSSFSYRRLDIVSENGSSYIALVDNKGKSVTNTEIWMLIAHKGDKGDTGPQGIQGIQGVQGEKGDKGDKGDTYQVTESDLQDIASQITSNANSEFNQHVEAKTTEFDTNATNKTNEFNENASTKTTEYNDNATTKVEEFDSSVDSIRKDINDNTSRIKRIESDLFDSGEASGVSINVKDSTLAEMQDIKTTDNINGWKQKTTEGKQLINFSNALDDPNIDFLFENNTWKLSDKSSETYAHVSYRLTNTIKNNPGKKVSFNCKKYNTMASANRAIVQLNIEYNDETPTKYINLLLASGNMSSYVIPNDTTNIKLAILGVYTNNSSIPAQNTLTIEEPILYFDDGGNPPEFEEFTGGESSPNPDFPQDIQVIEAGNYEVTSCGKNLYNYVDAKLSSVFGLSILRNEDGSFHITGTPEKDYIALIGSINITDRLIDKENYTLSQNIPAYIYAQIQAIPLKASDNTMWIYSSNSSIKTKTSFTVDKSKYAHRLGVQSGLMSNLGQNVDITLNFQLEKGNKATEFEPYQESKLPIPIPEGEFYTRPTKDWGDRLYTKYIESEKKTHLFLEKNVGRVTLNGTENWRVHPSISGWFYADNLIYSILNNTISDFMKSTNFIQKPYSNVINLKSGEFSYGFPDNKNRRLVMKETDFETVLEFKNWLAENNVTVYYQLAEPYTLDLGVVDMPLTYYPETNVFSDFPLPVEIAINYYRDPKKTISQLQSKIEELESNTIKNTTFATSASPGIVKANYLFASSVDSDGNFYPAVRSLTEYSNGNDNMFISKRTLENVLKPIRDQLAQLTPTESEVVENDNIQEG